MRSSQESFLPCERLHKKVNAGSDRLSVCKLLGGKAILTHPTYIIIQYFVCVWHGVPAPSLSCPLLTIS